MPLACVRYSTNPENGVRGYRENYREFIRVRARDFTRASGSGRRGAIIGMI